ncbi:pca operon transcription factor PcaQ [Pseudomonas oryzihabitans]|uniref:pca operon transcription factor PcaQ n=1 Tax=Pseudomonas oryzihabitans TaxID=47885 RepID=UPI0028570D40|nr:pca operon transcription factor PcaQ [Pseudomonas psychrotolerans]MDR6680597.1 LysR family pca operon transcriptional activator [Pseudomonas psychrotolerans]
MNLDNRIKFRHLLCFLEIAQQRSFAKAADAIAVSQPAISKTIRELEEILEVRLFERGKGEVTLTEAGLLFLRHAGPCVQALREGMQLVRGGEAGGLVRVGVLSTVESQVLPEVLARLHDRHRQLIVNVATGPSAYLLGQLRVGDLDLVVGRMTDSPDIHGLDFEHLYTEALTLVVRPGHPLSQTLPADLATLARYPLVLPLPGTTIRRHAESLFVQCGIPLSAQRLETLSPTLSRQYVRQSDALWIAPLDAVRRDLATGELVEVRLGVREAGGSVGICRNGSVPLSLATERFCVVLREVAGELSHNQ